MDWINGVDWIWVVVGVIFTLFVLRVLTNIVAEIFFFGILLGGIERYKYWLVPDLGFPIADPIVYKFAAGVGLAWLIARTIWLVADQWYKPLRKLSVLIFGRTGHYAKRRKKMFGS